MKLNVTELRDGITSLHGIHDYLISQALGWHEPMGIRALPWGPPPQGLLLVM